MKEANIQRAIMDFLTAKNITHWRCALGGVLVRRGNDLRYAKNKMKGFPDIAGICPGNFGRLFAIEVKTPGGKLSPEQKAWRDILLSRGVIHIVATSIEDVRMMLTAIAPDGSNLNADRRFIGGQGQEAGNIKSVL